MSVTRSDTSAYVVLVINASHAGESGTLSAPPSGTWKNVSPAGSPGGTTRAAPPHFALEAYAWQFSAAFEVSKAIGGSPGTAQVVLRWASTYGAAR